MTSEREFLERRLKIVEKNLPIPNKYDVDDQGSFHHRLDLSPTIEYALIREADLLKKLLKQVDEDKVALALGKWRVALGLKWADHREHYLPVQEEYERWVALPFPTRIETPEPPQMPILEVKDVFGEIWVVDDQLLNVLDDLKMRLKKWIDSDDPLN